jgi:hypothetical protein
MLDQTTMMKKLVTVLAALSGIGATAAMAQGLPPGTHPWESGWPAYVQARQAQPSAAQTPSRPDTTVLPQTADDQPAVAGGRPGQQARLKRG